MAKRKKLSRGGESPSPDCVYPGWHRVLDDEVAEARLDEVAKKVTEALAKKGVRVERGRVVWFAKAIARLAMDYGKMLVDGALVRWLTSPNQALAKEKPAVVIWRNREKGLRQVRKLLCYLDHLEMDGR